ncbi:Bug family tripartite tricarboxylate transporter substrate binding protein [Rhodoplanes sp. Z2-YC6860]|uniref:Bug family tripartite tricarboxylate transporter substrate binding protein n=1 Tax=Rhodoplanes sp. Z2-YC6860 TaxID=674703 RepID=UPI00078E71D3|nr:tripartite tricarboxylate transporter substrate binding protein [Rhodoplanes sp. Z2-YC6860]AMN45418.1 extra-cytoplasmic solute receptor [Rhodoplanes sp. Z2-YC6860]
MKTMGALLSLTGFLVAAQAQAQTYPSRPITLVVTAAAGGVTDVVARAFGQKLSEDWGQQVIVENKGGAAHVTGASAVAKAAPDGHTLMVAEAGTFTINPAIYPKGKLPYDEKTDFVPVTGLVRINQALLASKSLPVNNAKELIELAKQKPGELNFGTAGIGSAPHMNIELFKNLSGVKLNAVHYRGAAPALNDLIAGHIGLMSVSISLALPPYRAGQLKILGIGSEKRLAPIPDIPTVAETGLPGYESTTWFGLFAPAGTPREVVMKLNDEARKVFSDPAFDEKFLAPQMFQSLAMSPEAFEAFIQAETQKWSKVIRENDIKVE